MPLSQDQRAQLDGIVAKMDANGASPEEIKAVVADFQGKYSSAASTDQGSVLSRFGSGVKRVVVDPLVSGAKEAAGYVQQHPVEATVGAIAGIPQAKAIAAMLGGVKTGIEGEAAKAGALMDQEGAAARGPSGRGLSAVGHMIAAAVPGVGPMAAHAVETAATGDMAGGAGEITGMLVPAEGARALEASMATAAANRAVAGEVGGQGMDATRAAAAASNAAELQKANAAAEAVQGMVGLGKQPTNIEFANKTLGVRPKDLKKGYQPADAVIRNDIPMVGQTRQQVADSVSAKLGEFGATKQEMLKTPGVVGTADDIRTAAEILRQDAKKFSKVGDAATVAQYKRTFREINKLVTPNKVVSDVVGPDGSPIISEQPALFPSELSARHMEDILGRVDDLIKATGKGEMKSALRNSLYKVRKAISDVQAEGMDALLQTPEGGTGFRANNKQMRDLLAAKRAVSDKLLADQASGGPKPMGDVAPPESMVAPAPAPEPPPDVASASGVDPWTLAHIAAIASRVPFASRGVSIVRRILK